MAKACQSSIDHLRHTATELIDWIVSGTHASRGAPRGLKDHCHRLQSAQCVEHVQPWHSHKSPGLFLQVPIPIPVLLRSLDTTITGLFSG
ncbi:hypothetical protein MHYP_G00073720 [Metynnis hypsauchen]